MVKNSLGMESENYTQINKILYFGTRGDNIHIHMDQINASHEEKEALIIDGLEKLVAEVKKKPEIEKITATSWIVARHSRSIKKLGFEIMGPVDPKIIQEHFKNEKRPTHWAMMSREKFLTRPWREN